MADRSRLPGGRSNRPVRLLQLVRWLAQQDRWVDASEVVELYGGARRTVYRDLEALRRGGLPLEWDETLDLGWRLRRGALMRWLGETK